MPALRQKCRHCELMFDIEYPFPRDARCPGCRTPLVVKSSLWEFEFDRRVVLGMAAVVCVAAALMAFWAWTPGRPASEGARIVRVDPVPPSDGRHDPAPAAPVPANPQSVRVEVVVLPRTPPSWKTAPLTAEAMLAQKKETRVTAADGREVKFTPVPVALRAKDMPPPDVARASAAEQARFLKANLGAIHVRDQIYELPTAPAQKRFFMITPCVIGDDPGNLIIYGESPEDVEKAAEKVQAEAK